MTRLKCKKRRRKDYNVIGNSACVRIMDEVDEHRILLGALQVVDDGMRNWSAWTTSGQSHGSMFSQDTNGSSCLSSEIPNCSLRGTSLVSLLDSD